MPELPEVETVRAGAEPHLVGRTLRHTELARTDLRWPIPVAAVEALRGSRCTAVTRRSKFLLLHFAGREPAVALIHLGMTGRLIVAPSRTHPEWRKHEHWRMDFGDRLVRYVDARRFGALGVADAGNLAAHPWLASLGQEPLDPGFDGAFLHRVSRGRKCSIKTLLMDARVVVGIGNIYASESCWHGAVRPRRAARSLNHNECDALVAAARQVLLHAIAAGGTTLRDYVGVAEEAGYFARELAVYERDEQPCRRCGAIIRRTVEHGRSTYWCANCQR